ncbi:MAG: type 1 glutamine amidotransferase [Gloeomargaritaceae cyanobacterium C42_A2020_066]|nr:type 1 glutamine amidotransferase [Gloeomargaritaceae cyanobacterium C42_A2020_066]
MARILVFQHLPVEHPGSLRDFLAEDGFSWDVVELDAGDPIPSLAGYDALWVMGGPMDVWEEDSYPWLRAEKAAIREAILERGMAYLGLCLGHQLLADALGGQVGKAAQAEVGLMTVTQTPAGRAHPLFVGLPETIPCLQWHGAEVQQLPPGAQTLAQSPHCAIQALALGERVLGLQFHVEITPTTIQDWDAIPAYRQALETVLGPAGRTTLEQATQAAMPHLHHTARQLYRNWVRTLG